MRPGQRLGDYIQIGEMAFFPAAGWLWDAGITNKTIADLADQLGIDHWAELRATIEVIVDRIRQPTHALKAWREVEMPSSPEEVEAAEKASRLCRELTELLTGASWPLGTSIGLLPEGYKLLEGLRDYRRWLEQFRFVNPRTRQSRPAMTHQQAVVLCLASAWPRLVGEEPVCQAKPREYRFYSACVEICRLLGIDPLPSKASVRDWIKGANSLDNEPAQKVET